jgi:nucleoside 2-deoxyribosyltransferase
MKIYFAGSITGGRDDSALYAKIISILSRHGKVLTEHIGHSNISAMGETDVTPEYIYERDAAWLAEADVLVAEVTTTSLGVGYEIGLAESLHKKILCLYRPSTGKRLSSMIGGNKKLKVKQYEKIGDLEPIFAGFFA